MKNFLILFTLTIQVFTVFGQQQATFAGKVISESGPITGASVRFEGTDYAAATDENGNFTFSDMAPGPYTLTVQAIGYLAASVNSFFRAGKRRGNPLVGGSPGTQ